MIVDDVLIFVQQLSVFFGSDERLQVVGVACNGADALALAGQVQPDLVLLDINMPGESGLDLIAPLRARLPFVKIIMFSAGFTPYTVQTVLEHQVEGYVEKRSPLPVLQEAVHCVRQGGVFFSPGVLEVKQHLAENPKAFHKILSKREQRILMLMSEGLSDGEIARVRDVSVDAVVTSRKRIRVKLNLHCDRELLAYARYWGLNSKDPA